VAIICEILLCGFGTVFKTCPEETTEIWHKFSDLSADARFAGGDSCLEDLSRRIVRPNVCNNSVKVRTEVPCDGFCVTSLSCFSLLGTVANAVVVLVAEIKVAEIELAAITEEEEDFDHGVEMEKRRAARVVHRIMQTQSLGPLVCFTEKAALAALVSERTK